MNQPIDWEAAKQRLRAGEAALEQALVPDPERLEAVYRQRAGRLARRQVQVQGAPTAPVLVFWAGEERCGLELPALAGVSPFAGCAPLPKAPPEVLGLANHRGQLCPVLDLAALLGLSSGGDSGYLLWLRRQDRLIGAKVERVEEVRQVVLESLVSPETLVGDSRCLKGLAPDGLRLLDPQAIRSHPLFKEVSRA
jgi:purine-binding chemotaxis protein CheW